MSEVHNKTIDTPWKYSQNDWEPGLDWEQWQNVSGENLTTNHGIFRGDENNSTPTEIQLREPNHQGKLLEKDDGIPEWTNTFFGTTFRRYTEEWNQIKFKWQLKYGQTSSTYGPTHSSNDNKYGGFGTNGDRLVPYMQYKNQTIKSIESNKSSDTEWCKEDIHNKKLKEFKRKRCICFGVTTFIICLVLAACITSALLIHVIGTPKNKNVYVQSKITATATNQKYSEGMGDASSQVFRDFEEQFCSAAQIKLDQTSNCKVESLRNGSIVVIFFIYIKTEKSEAEVKGLIVEKLFVIEEGKEQFQIGIFAIKTDSFSVTETQTISEEILPNDSIHRPVDTDVTSSSSLSVSTTKDGITSMLPSTNPTTSFASFSDSAAKEIESSTHVIPEGTITEQIHTTTIEDSTPSLQLKDSEYVSSSVLEMSTQAPIILTSTELLIQESTQPLTTSVVDEINNASLSIYHTKSIVEEMYSDATTFYLTDSVNSDLHSYTATESGHQSFILDVDSSKLMNTYSIDSSSALVEMISSDPSVDIESTDGTSDLIITAQSSIASKLTDLHYASSSVSDSYLTLSLDSSYSGLDKSSLADINFAATPSLVDGHTTSFDLTIIHSTPMSNVLVTDSFGGDSVKSLYSPLETPSLVIHGSVTEAPSNYFTSEIDIIKPSSSIMDMSTSIPIPKPDVKVTGETVYQDQGNLTFTCTVDNYYNFTSIILEYDDIKIFNITENGNGIIVSEWTLVQIKLKDTLDLAATFNSPTCEDSNKIFRCNVNGDWGVVNDVTSSVVKVKPETPDIHLPIKFIENEDTLKDIYCSMDAGVPAATVSWSVEFFDGRQDDPYDFSAVTTTNSNKTCSNEVKSSIRRSFDMSWHNASLCCTATQDQITTSTCKKLYILPADYCFGKEDKLYDHPYDDCYLFVQCAFNRTYISACGTTHCFNEGTQSCSGAIATTTDPNFVDDPYSCKGKPNYVFIPVEDSCKNYIQCVNGVNTPGTCPGNTYFIGTPTYGHKCDYDINNAYCKRNGTQTTE